MPLFKAAVAVLNEATNYRAIQKYQLTKNDKINYTALSQKEICEWKCFFVWKEMFINPWRNVSLGANYLNGEEKIILIKENVSLPVFVSMYRKFSLELGE